MAHTYDELKHSTLAQLKEIAKEMDHEAVEGFTQMNKDHLLQALCKALGIEMHMHHEVLGIDKSSIKKQIKELKVERDKALEAHDHKQLKDVRRQIKKLKHKIRRATV
ncbi:hypothetical protein IH824_17715 [candidate division KSB1 bacterium]|nr:hypothetical protein [candidate division KSB1 bacterium]